MYPKTTQLIAQTQTHHYGVFTKDKTRCPDYPPPRRPSDRPRMEQQNLPPSAVLELLDKSGRSDCLPLRGPSDRPRIEQRELPPIRDVFPELQSQISPQEPTSRTNSSVTSPVGGYGSSGSLPTPDYTHLRSPLQSKRRRPPSIGGEEGRERELVSQVPRLYRTASPPRGREYQYQQHPSNGKSGRGMSPTMARSLRSPTGSSSWDASPRRASPPTQQQHTTTGLLPSMRDAVSVPVPAVEPNAELIAPLSVLPRPSHRDFEQRGDSCDMTMAHRRECAGLDMYNSEKLRFPASGSSRASVDSSTSSRGLPSPYYRSGGSYAGHTGHHNHQHHPPRFQSLSLGSVPQLYPYQGGDHRRPFSPSAGLPYGPPGYDYGGRMMGEFGGMGMGMGMGHHGGDVNNKQRKRRGNLPKETTDKLRAWFLSHLSHPYPTEDEKQKMMQQTGLQMSK